MKPPPDNLSFVRLRSHLRLISEPRRFSSQQIELGLLATGAEKGACPACGVLWSVLWVGEVGLY